MNVTNDNRALDGLSQNLIDAMPENVAIVEQTGCILSVNSAWEAFSVKNLGDKKKTSNGSNYFEAVYNAAENNDEVALKVKVGIQKILSKEITCFELEYSCYCHSINRWFITNIQEIGSFSPRLFLCSHKDITDLVLRKTKVIVTQHLEAVGHLSAGIAHDFNNLLGVLMGNIELAQCKLSPANPINELLNRSLVAISRGASLIQNLLTYSRKQNLNIESINLDNFIQNTCRLMPPLLGENIDIKAGLNDSPLTIQADHSLLTNAILNIAANARHAMPRGGELTINVSREEVEGKYFITSKGEVFGSYALIAVSDTGSGIEEEDLNKIFEPFFTTKDVGEGSGLGLSMVYGFMSQSNGHIHVKTQIGKGTTIFLYLPLANRSILEGSVTTEKAF
jgi:signal transduction histidine kinase